MSSPQWTHNLSTGVYTLQDADTCPVGFVIEVHPRKEFKQKGEASSVKKGHYLPCHLNREREITRLPATERIEQACSAVEVASHLHACPCVAV